MDCGLWTRRSKRIASSSGIALVLVLSILAILIVSSTALVVMTRLELASAKSFLEQTKARYVAQAGIEHARALLRLDRVGVGNAPPNAYDWDLEPWHNDFAGSEVDTDGDEEGDAVWMDLLSVAGKVVGRYACQVVDESSKVNLNASGNLSRNSESHSSNQGWSPFEISLEKLFVRLAGGSNPPLVASQIVKYRHGKDGFPGDQGVDDDGTQGPMEEDKIDNDGGGFMDEQGEGIDEPTEFRGESPSGDDQPFRTLQELRRVSPEMEKAYPSIHKKVTLYSRDRESDSLGRPRLNINRVRDPAKLQAILFEEGVSDAAEIAVNIIDFADKDHAASVIGLEGEEVVIGAEAVQINEVLAQNKAVLSAGGENVDQSNIADWAWEEDAFVNNEGGKGTWAILGLGAGIAFRVTLLSGRAYSDGFTVNGKICPGFDQNGKWSMGIEKANAQGKIELTLQDNNNGVESRFSGIELEGPQFVELVNLSEESMDITGWDLMTETSVTGAQNIGQLASGASAVIPPRSYLVATTDQELLTASFDTNTFPWLALPNLKLAPVGEELVLRDDNNEWVSRAVNYGDSQALGVSREREDPTKDEWANSVSGSVSVAKPNSRVPQAKELPLVRDILYANIGEVLNAPGGSPWEKISPEILGKIADRVTVSEIPLEAERADFAQLDGWIVVPRTPPKTEWYFAPSDTIHNATFRWGETQPIEDGTYTLYIYGKRGYPLKILEAPGLTPGASDEIEYGPIEVRNGVLEISLKNEVGREAYFDRIVLTPRLSIAGRININTASLDTLMTLPGMTEEIANEMINNRPYVQRGNLLPLEGVKANPAVFQKISNLITVRSHIYGITSLGHSLSVVGKVQGEKKIQAVVER